MEHRYHIKSGLIKTLNSCQTSPRVCFLNTYTKKKNPGLWLNLFEKGYLQNTFCREVAYGNIRNTSLTNGISEQNVKLAVIIKTDGADKQIAALQNLLNILEKRYKIEKTNIIKLEPIIMNAATGKPVKKSSKKITNTIIVFDSPHFWTRNSIICSIFTLYIRLSLTRSLYDKVKCYRDIKEATLDLFNNNKKYKTKPPIFTTSLTLEGVKTGAGDIGFVTKTCLLWDYIIKNQEELMGKEVAEKTPGSMGIDSVAQVCNGGTYRRDIVTKAINIKKIKSLMKRQKMLVYKGA